MENDGNNNEIKQDDSKESLSRRKAIKRIAALFAGAAVGTKVFAMTDPELLAYVNYVLPYADSVKAPYSSNVYHSFKYYPNHTYHSIYVPPPYSSTKKYSSYSSYSSSKYSSSK